jgi:gliding motility-associated-like protein
MFAGLFLFWKTERAQCIKDSNYYSITYTATKQSLVVDGLVSSQSETVALLRNEGYNNFISKFTSDGSVIWSNEYVPDYPFLYWYSYPWYEQTKVNGIIMAADSSYYAYGSMFEHGSTLNGGEDPPGHWAGFILHLDRFGEIISGKYLGNWRTDYTVNSLIQLANGNFVVYLRSFFEPYVSKVVCLDGVGNVIWGTPLKTGFLYTEINDVNPVMKQCANGNIVVANEMLRQVDDTIFYPFTPPIIVPAPLYYFSTFQIDGKNGNLLWERSFQCPPLHNTNVNEDFIPQIKSITELPNGNLSFAADMYMPIDNVIFYKHKFFSKRAVNLITNQDGYFLKLIAYRPQNGSCSLQNAHGGSNGEQTLLIKDTSSQQLIIFKIDQNGRLIRSKTFTNINSTESSSGFVLQKPNNEGYFLFQGDPYINRFNLYITNSIGNDSCVQFASTLVAEDATWPWYVDKVNVLSRPFEIDFRYSSFNFTKKSYPLLKHNDCQYQYICCTDFIDSLHPHNISICENESYTLPDNTKVKAAGTYYQTLKTQRGCDSVVYYNMKIIKSPSHLTASPDTCLENASGIKLKATGGYDSYLWNRLSIKDSVYTVHSPGSYSVTVENMCGAKTDTIHVYDHCSFPIYFPNAFTPNGDFLNDILKVPEANKDKFRRLSIYNRWGELVFYTTTQGNGWDGKFNGIPQPTGVYVYFLEMEGLSGQRLNQKGTVTLIR